MPTRTFNDCDDVFERNLIRQIEDQGWSTVHATSPPPPGLVPLVAVVAQPTVAYTVGLHSQWGHPECLVLGLPPERSQALLRLVCEEVKRGQRFSTHADYAHLLEGYRCRFQTLDRAFYRDYLSYCRWFYRGDGFSAVQLLWPDEQGNFPDEVGFDPRMQAHQPVLA